jgi:hypothetical protein
MYCMRNACSKIEADRGFGVLERRVGRVVSAVQHLEMTNLGHEQSTSRSY